MKKYDVVDYIIAYESGGLDSNGILEFFAELVKSGRAWTLQGHYGRTARGLIASGWLDDKGNVLKEA